jgi:sugar phosphate isomerase/epimerase
MKIGINPLPWVMDSDFNFHLDTPTLSAAFEELKAAGFTAVQADVPEGMDAAAYSAFLDEFGLRPAPGYFSGFFDKSADLAKTIEAAKQNAAKQAQLGLTEVMIAQRLSPQRIARPADLVGVLKALPDAFGGWLVVEVDVPDLGTPAESTHASARWIRTQPLLQGGLV